MLNLKKIIYSVIVIALIGLWAGNITSLAQYVTSTLPPPPPPPDTRPSAVQTTVPQLDLHFNVKNTVPKNYDDVQGLGEYAADLKTPSNITSEVEFDPETGCYVIHTKLGDYDIVTPYIMSSDEYSNADFRRSMMEYYRQKNADNAKDEKDPFNFLDMQFGMGPLESVFGPGGLQLKTTGSVIINMGVKTNYTDNPALSISQRRKSYFNFEQKIQASITASVGDKMRFNMSYNTGATFDFDSKNLKLAYEGKEDEIIKNIEAGNVSMTTGSSLIHGSAALFGIKTKLQFGKLTATALVSQQNSESQTVSSRGGSQTQDFYIAIDKYDQNRNFFLSHYFRDNYDQWCSTFPLVSSGIHINNIEVWVTNKRSNYNESRNIMAFTDLAEGNPKNLGNPNWTGLSTLPESRSNNMYAVLDSLYPQARYMKDATTTLDPLRISHEFKGGKDYEKIESARLLKEGSEYILNANLGYIMLKTALAGDEILAVAYDYTYDGQNYQVGEFSKDKPETDQSLYVKMLKGTIATPETPLWDLTMRNVYDLGAYQIQKKNFKLNIKYLSDTTGTELIYIPAGDTIINGKPLLQVMNLDRLDANEETNIDGKFDFLEGRTIQPSMGKVIFPVVEPFGEHLRKQFKNDELAKNFIYTELYDSTLVVAQQFSDKNKFVLAGEYQSSSGSVIRLNATNVARGSVVVTAGGVTLTENSDYTVDYTMGTVTITNQSIIDAGTNISVSLENQSLFNMQRKTLLGLDLDYAFNKNFHIGATAMHYGEKAIGDKLAIGSELVNNTIWGVNMSYNTQFMWLTNLLNKIPTVNAVAPSSLSFQGEFAQLIPHQAKTGSISGSSYIDDFESAQSGMDIRSPYSWSLASVPSDTTMFPEGVMTKNVDYGKNRALLAWYSIDRMFTQRNSTYAPGYIKNDLDAVSYYYARDVNYSEVFPGRDLNYGQSSTIQTLNLSFYPRERGPYNLDGTRVDRETGNLLYPEQRWGGIMRKMDNTNFELANYEYIQFWMLDPFLDEELDNKDGGYLYFNLGEISEDILKDGLKSYENGLPITAGDTTFVIPTVWGKVSSKTSLTYAFDNTNGARVLQDVGLDGISTSDEFKHESYSKFLSELDATLSDEAKAAMQDDPFSPYNDPAGDNYAFYRHNYYDNQKSSILERYKHFNGTDGNSLSQSDSGDGQYQTSRSTPDVEDINQDNTLNDNEHYFQYRVAIHPDSMVVGKNYITDIHVANVLPRNRVPQQVTWYQFTIPLFNYQKKVGTIQDFSTIRFMRMFMRGFKDETHLRFASLELVKGEWRNYKFNLNTRGDSPANGSISINKVNIESNASRQPVNYVLPPGESRVINSGQSQIIQRNEQSMQLSVDNLDAGDARGVYRNTDLDLRTYKRLQMFVHNEATIDDLTNLRSGDVSLFIRLGSDVKNNYYEYEIPLTVTPPGQYKNNVSSDRLIVWPQENMLDINLDVLVNAKKHRNADKMAGVEGVGYATRYLDYDDDHPKNRIYVTGNPSLSKVRVILIGIRNNAATSKSCVVWVDELRVTDFDSEGGWAAKASMTLNMSDVATLNMGFHKETEGFGSVDQSLSQRRLDNYNQYNIAVQSDLGRFIPEKAKLRAPIYYSYTNEKTTPKYNPMDQDVRLDEALETCETKEQKDSIMAYAVTQRTAKSFSISGLKFDVKTMKNPMPWDPANFSFSYSFNKQHLNDPENVYENTNDYRGGMQYSWTPYAKPFKPFSRFINEKNKNMKFFRDWEFQWLPTNISFNTNISRYYYEQLTRNEADANVTMDPSVSKNFLWDRQFALSWNFTKSLSLTFNSNTTAHIMEPIGQVNRKLDPTNYYFWRDSVIRSIKDMGTPWGYNQTFSLTYKAPFSQIPILSWITANASYNSTYRWDRGTVVNSTSTGNTIANQTSRSLEGRFNLEQFYSKIPYLKKVDERFSSKSSSNRAKAATKQPKKEKPKKFNRTIKLSPDSATIVNHKLGVKNIKVSATTTDDKPFKVDYTIKDKDNLEIQNLGTESIKLTVTEVQKEEKKTFFTEAAMYASRVLMSVRNFNLRYKYTTTLSLPQFKPVIGDAFGQTRGYGPMAPGLDFAFGFAGQSYIERSRNRGWLLGDKNQTTPALYSATKELTMEVALEPISGLKITLTGNRTDNRTNQIHFMYEDPRIKYGGSYIKTHIMMATAFKGFDAKDNYHSETFDRFIENIDVVAERLQQGYVGTTYPNRGFLVNNGGGSAYDEMRGTVNKASSDVLIPAFMAAYSGKNAKTIDLNPFPSIKAILPNWRATYDGLMRIPLFKRLFKSFNLTHSYQCTYNVGNYSSFSDWVPIDDNRGFSKDAISGNPIPSSPYNIASVTVAEKFAPLIGFSATFTNDLTLNVQYELQRNLTLNSAAAQLVEASSKSFVVGGSYKIANFNQVLKIKSKQQNVNNDLTFNLSVKMSDNTSIIRKIDQKTAQPTNGTRNWNVNFTANYVVSKRITMGAFFDMQTNTPLVSNNAYPTRNSNYGLSINMSLVK